MVSGVSSGSTLPILRQDRARDPTQAPDQDQNQDETRVGRNRRRGRLTPQDQASLPGQTRLTPEQQSAVAQLAETDRRVRAHEQAHVAAAGPYARGGPSYSYATGTDGKLYAVAGEVSIDISPVANNPEETIRKARVVQAAANAPADPSAQDRQVAAAAAQLEFQARVELAARERAEKAPNQPADRRIAAYQATRESENPPDLGSFIREFA